METGARIGALESLNHEKKEIKFYGYGVYLGHHVPKMFENISRSMTNPHLRLDNGKEVWGYMCWWSDEQATKKNIDLLVAKGYNLINVDPPEDKPLDDEPLEEEVSHPTP